MKENRKPALPAGVFALAAAMFFVFSCRSAYTPPAPEETPETPEPPPPAVEEAIPAAVPAINNPLPAGRIDTIEDFEEGSFWYAGGINDAGDYSISAETAPGWATNGERAGVWTFAPVPEGGEAGFSCDNLLLKDFEGATYLICDINNTAQEPLSLYVELETGDIHEKTATAPVLIGVGENINVMFDLRYELRDVSGNRIYGILDASDVRTVSFRIQGKAKAAALEIDNIRLSR